MSKAEYDVPKVSLYAAGVAFTLSIGFSFFGIKQCVPYADTLTILCYRYVAALISVALWIGIARALGRYPKPELGRPKGKLYMTAGSV